MAESTYKCSLSEELKTKAREELNEKEEWRARDIQALRDMVKAHPGLHARMDDEFLLRFLWARKFDYDRAYQLLLNFYQIRAENKDTFMSITPSEAHIALKQGITLVLPKCDKHGRRILLDRPGVWNPQECDILKLMRGFVVNIEQSIREENTQINGVVVVSDLSGFGMQQAKSFTRSVAQLMGAIMQDAFPMRVKKIFIVNEPAVFDYVFAIFKPFLKSKFLSRMSMIGTDYTKMGEEIGFENLPEELGGQLGPVENIAEKWWQKLQADEDYFKEQQKYYLDLPHQIVKKPQSNEVVEGLVGTYKKLSVE